MAGISKDWGSGRRREELPAKFGTKVQVPGTGNSFMSSKNDHRRNFLTSSVAVGMSSMLASCATLSQRAPTDSFEFEVVRTEAQWRSMFDADTYRILREGGTEKPRSSVLWNDYRDGEFACKGCNLPNYDSVWRTEVDKGWVFFRQSRPNALLMGIDGEAPDGMSDAKTSATIEVHCRRCASHMGHILRVNGEVLHCINGKALNFIAA